MIKTMLKRILLSFGLVSVLGFSGLFISSTYAADTIVTAGDSEFGKTDNLFNGLSGTNTQNIGINTIGTTEDKGGGLIQVIKNAINWVLGMLSLVALILCLWGGFQIVTAAGDDGKQKKGVSVLKHAAIGLVVIGLAWFVVTIIFWLLRGITNGGSTTPSGT